MPNLPDEPPHPKSPPPGKGARSLGRFMARDGREHFWSFLDLLDARPLLRKTLLFGVPAFIIAVGLGVWGYQHWARTNALRIARQWLDADRLDRAGMAIQDALTNEPDLPASWRLASELAWRMGNRSGSVEYAKKAAVVSRYRADEVIAWAEASILSDDDEQAQEAATFLEPAAARESPRALRLVGEIARRSRRFVDARDQFQAALDADTKAGVRLLAVDEIPLGIVCLRTGSNDDRIRGEALLSKWASDPIWGVEALRALLADAGGRRERDAAVRWAEALRINPRCTLGDIPVCLQAFADFAPERFQAILAPMEDKSRSNPIEAAQLLGWLTQIGQGAEAARWGDLIDPSLARKPPIAQGIAESLRATHRWADLRAWVDRVEWGREMGFLGSGYTIVAARHLGDEATAKSAWQSVLADGRSSPAHAFLLGDSLYAWGYPKEAAELLWEAADRPDLAYQALGSLARLYQVQRDAAGQYKAFGRLNEMRPSDRRIANNFAYFAALTDLGSQTHIEHIAEDNFTHEPTNVIYRSTYAFVLVWSGQNARALALMDPVSRDWKKSPAIAFSYGAALAGVGRKTEAKEVFDSLNPKNLSPQELAWVTAAVR